MLPTTKIFLLGGFNADLLKSDIESNISDFLDILTSNMFIPHIIHPTRITPNSKTLIDNIFSNSINFAEGKSGNLTLSLSDHLAQFLIIPIEFNYDNKKEKLTQKTLTENFFFTTYWMSIGIQQLKLKMGIQIFHLINMKKL